MIPLDATPKSPTANSYATVAEATDVITNGRLYSNAWRSATDDDKARSLIWATRLIDVSFDFTGAVTDLAQALKWPRVGIVDDEGRYFDQDTIPLIIKQATAEFAVSLLARDPTLVPKLLGQGFKSATLGPIKVDVDMTQVLPLIPPSVLIYFAPFGIMKAGSDASFNVAKLVRA
jgi:hypothetical protein